MTITLRHMQILSAVAGNRSLTLAAKQLGLSQPSLSQQLSKLEGDLNQRLVDRSAKGLSLTDSGRFLLEKAESILNMVEEAEVGLGQFERGVRGDVTIGTLTSLARGLVTPASIDIHRHYPEIQLNVVELSPRSIVRQLQSRQIQMALLTSTTLTNQDVHFTKVKLAEDCYVLAVPSDVTAGRLPPLDSAIVVDFGPPFQGLIDRWYQKFMPGHNKVAQCRTYETALSMVEAGLGAAIVPLLATQVNGRLVFDVKLHSLPIEPRCIWALLPSQYRYMQPHARILETLVTVGKSQSEAGLKPPPLLPLISNGKTLEPIGV